MNQTAILILAAGSSSRLGEPKQLITFNNKTLINHIVDEAKSVTNEVLVITGAYNNEVSAALQNSDVTVLFNPDWEEGQGTGIVAGVKALSGKVENIIIAVCDQPFVSAAIFESLITQQQKTNKGIIASAYADTTGTPGLFSKKYFNDLLQLYSAEGAKKLLSMYQDDLAVVSFPKGALDIDTKEDLAKLSAADF